MCEIDWYDPCKVWNENHRKARKSHICDCCLRTITKDSCYVKHTSLLDSWVSEKICAICDAIRGRFQKEHGMIPIPSNTVDSIRECLYSDRKSKEWRTELAFILRGHKNYGNQRKSD